MAALIGTRLFRPEGQTRSLLLKWTIALLVPLLVFTVIWGESIVNQVLPAFLTISDGGTALSLVLAILFVILFYGSVLALAGYLTAADSGHRSTILLWCDVFMFMVLPLIIISILNDLVVGLAASAVLWVIYLFVRRRVLIARHVDTAPSLESVAPLDAQQRAALITRATLGGFCLATAFAVISLVIDLVYFFSGQLPPILLIWVVVRTILLPVVGYFLGRLGGFVALRRTIDYNANKRATATAEIDQRKLESLSRTRAREEAQDLVPNDLPLQSSGARRFYMLLLLVFLLLYPVIDPYLFGAGGAGGRIASYDDAGRYVILALGLNIVVGFAGLLDLGYVAFFAIGAYVWGLFGSQQWNAITGMIVDPNIWPWFFWPMIIVSALIAALWGVLLGAPTLRLRGDYLAIVTLGFGEIVPIFFLYMDKYTNGTNGIAGIYSPAFPGVTWNVSTPVPFYYLILAMIALVLFANVRLRDSRLGRAWIAIREDEVAAASSGVNLVRTKLFAFGAGAFFSGIAGAYFSAKFSSVTPDSFSFNDSVIFLAMVVLGGLGSIPGVVVGALVVYAINVLVLSQLDTMATNSGTIVYSIHNVIAQFLPGFTFNNIRNLIFGTILVIIMIFRPEGLIPSSRRRRELRRTTNEDEEVEVGALDAPPGTPSFEAETHVE